MCLALERRCNGIVDCLYGEDELGCTNLQCGVFRNFRCHLTKGNQNCISDDWVCDGRADCPNGEDESATYCPPDHVHPCESGVFCNSSCLPSRKICDGVKDCPDNQDESDCNSCDPLTHFTCPFGDIPCIELDHVCDGMNQCSDGFDEVGCPPNDGSCEGSLKCENQNCVIPQKGKTGADMICDGNDDCVDKSDEKDCKEGAGKGQWKFSWSRSSIVECYGNDGKPQNHTTYNCHKGPCILLESVCDGIVDCPHGMSRIYDPNSAIIAFLTHVNFMWKIIFVVPATTIWL